MGKRARRAVVMWSFFAVLVAAYQLAPRVLGVSLPVRALLGAGYLLMAVIAVVTVARVVLHTNGIERRAWAYLSASVALLAAGDAMWISRQVAETTVEVRVPEPSYILFALAFLPLAMYIITVLAASLSGTPVLTKARYAIDLSIAALFSVVAVFVFVIAPSFPASTANMPLWVIEVAFVLAGVVAFVALLAWVVESEQRLWARWEGKIVVAVSAFLFADMTGDFLMPSASRVFGSTASNITDNVWMLGYFLIAMGALQRLQSRMEIATLPVMAHAQRSQLRWYDIVMAVLLTASVPFVLFSSRYGVLGDVEFWALGSATFVLALLVIARSVVLTSENGNLLSHTVVDPLTGVYNHRFFQERVATEIERARHSGESVSLVFMDIDEFGAVNEQFGHQRGDQCLVALSRLLKAGMRKTDTLCRMGGDEFALVLPSTSSSEAVLRAQAVLRAVREDALLCECVENISFGIAASPEHATERTGLVAKADGALYWAQATGLGNIVVYDTEVVEALGPEDRLRIAEEQSYMHTVETLAAAVDARDWYTQNHSRNVSRHASRVARFMGFGDGHVRLVEIAGLLHDVGKIGVPDTILRKPGPLTPEEQLKIEEHPELGERILSATIFKEILPWVLSHHERWDGGGYPQGLVGEEIPLEARLLAVCDAYDAMVSDRPYRRGIEHASALKELERNAGTQFDARIVHLFIEASLVDDAFGQGVQSSSR